MSQSNKPISPLRQRMIDDLTMRKLSAKTQIAYIRAVKHLTRFLGRSPDTANCRVGGGESCLSDPTRKNVGSTFAVKRGRQSRYPYLSQTPPK